MSSNRLRRREVLGDALRDEGLSGSRRTVEDDLTLLGQQIDDLLEPRHIEMNATSELLVGRREVDLDEMLRLVGDLVDLHFFAGLLGRLETRG